MRLARTSTNRRNGVVLLAVLIVVALLSLAAYHYFDLMNAEYRAADSYARSTQAKSFAESGVNYAAVLLSNKEAYDSMLGGNPYDNPSVFQGILVQDSEVPRNRGRFSIITPLGYDDPGDGTLGFRYGVSDESGKLNLNGLLKIDSSGETARNALMKLPNMSEDIADAILDWLDDDDTDRGIEAETSYYSGLNPPYECKNGPMETLEELLYVRGVTPRLLFGNDSNRNGMLDPEEQGQEGDLDLGWAAYLTVYGREQNVDSLGQPRIYINDSNTNRLYDKMTTAGIPPELANYIILYRQNGPATLENPPQISGIGSLPDFGGAVQGSSMQSAGGMQRDQLRLSNRTRGRRRIASMFELVGSVVAIQNGDRQQPVYYSSPLNTPDGLQQMMPLLLEKMTTTRDTDLPARVNILTAPSGVLRCLPGMKDDDVTAIMNARPSVLAQGATSDAIFSAAVNLFTEANLSIETLRAIERYITVRSQMYRVQVVGHFDSGGPFYRVEAIIDTNNGRPRIVYWRDLTELGRGFNLLAP